MAIIVPLRIIELVIIVVAVQGVAGRGAGPWPQLQPRSRCHPNPRKSARRENIRTSGNKLPGARLVLGHECTQMERS